MMDAMTVRLTVGPVTSGRVSWQHCAAHNFRASGLAAGVSVRSSSGVASLNNTTVVQSPVGVEAGQGHCGSSHGAAGAGVMKMKC